MTPVCHFHGKDCRGRLQWHHVVSRQRIRRAWKAKKAELRRGLALPAEGGQWTLSSLINDERNRVFLCVFHHGQVEQRKLYVTPDEAVWEFAREYGLDAELEADVARGRSHGEAA